MHLFNVQVINRVGWDGAIRPPDPNEVGWKETVRMNPLEDAIVALRPVAPKLPFGVPESNRLLNPAIPLGSTMGFTNIDQFGNPVTPPQTNVVTNFGWEYVWHCHLLGHEEFDMMRPIIFKVVTNAPAASVLTGARGSSGSVLTWTDPTPWNGTGPASTLGDPTNEVGYQIQRAVATGGVPGAYSVVGTALANATTFTDTTAAAGTTYSYIVFAYNAATLAIGPGAGTQSNALQL